MRTGFRRDIEGLRAVAVLLVLLFHLRAPGGEGGFAGVDVFFVISGFLITGLLIREVESTGTVSLTRFYARRARRLLPVALLVTLLTLLTGSWVLPGSALSNLVADSVGATLYVVNWVLAYRSVDYLAEDAGASPLKHYWSLSVEEQFYLLWPLLILLASWLATRVLRRGSPRTTMLVLLVLLTGSSLAWSGYLTATDAARAYFVTTTRLWELGAGALLAFALPALRRLPRWASEGAVLLGLGLILLTLLAFDTRTAWPGTAALVPVLGSALVIAAGCGPHATLGGRLLGTAPTVWIGGLSYAIYLWHWPLILLAEASWGALPGPARAGLGVLAVLLAWATKHLLEDPVRYHRGLATHSLRTLTASGVGMALVCGAALTAYATRPQLVHDPDAPGAAALVGNPSSDQWELIPDPTLAYTATGPISPDPDRAPEDAPSYYGDGCQVDQGDPAPRPDCVYGATDSEVEVLMMGDSKMGQWFSAVEAIAHAENWRLTTYLKSDCPFTVAGAEAQDCNEFGRTVLDQVEAQERAPEVALLSMVAGSPPELEQGVVEAVRRLQAHGTAVVVVQDNDHPPGNRYECAAEHDDDLAQCEFDPSGGGGQALLGSVAESTGAEVVDLNEWICPGGTDCPVAIGEQLIWRQGSHLTDTYVRSLTPFLYRELAGLGLVERPVGDILVDAVPERAT